MKATQSQLKSINRLKAQAVFDCLRSSKTRWVSTGLALQACARAADGGIGCAVSASKKTAALATDRNRMRRRLKAVAASVLPDAAQSGMDYLITARHQTLKRDMADLETDLRWCLKKLNLIKRSEAEHAD